MSVSVVWLDVKGAKLFYISEDRMERESIGSTESNAWYDIIAEKLKLSTMLLILGPGNTKDVFFTWIRDRYPALAKKVVGCETSEQGTDQQIAVQVMKYFRTLKVGKSERNQRQNSSS